MIRFVAVIVFLMCGHAGAAEVRVAAAIAPVWSIVDALAQGTSIRAIATPEKLPGMGQLERAMTRQSAAIGARLAQVDAVVTLSSVWAEDPLYREARAANLRVVQIDAGRALGKGGGSVMLMNAPANQVPWRKAASATGVSPWVWFSSGNVVRMAEIIAADLVRLAPDDAATINANLSGLQREALALRAEYEQKFLEDADQPIFVLTDRFAYLFQEFGIFADGALLDDDIRWTDQDLSGVEEMLRQRDIKVAVHHWRPDDRIVEAIRRGGAELLILDEREHSDGSAAAPPQPNAWRLILKTNLDALHAALQTAKAKQER